MVLVVIILAYFAFPVTRLMVCEPTPDETRLRREEMLSTFLLGAGVDTKHRMVCEGSKKPLRGTWSCRFPLESTDLAKLVNVWNLRAKDKSNPISSFTLPFDAIDCCTADGMFCQKAEETTAQERIQTPRAALVLEPSTEMFAFPEKFPKFINSDQVGSLLANSAGRLGCIELHPMGDPD